MKNSLRKSSLILLLVCLSSASYSQVLISLIFGEKLNSDKIEFGLVGGLNRSYLKAIEGSEGLNNFNLGFYFHIMLMENSFISTGVLVKSNVGATGMPVYSVGDPDFDEIYADGELTKKINYFYVPVMWQQRFSNQWYLEGGIQSGLRYKAYDIFDEDDYGGELSYKRDVRDDYTRFDFGLIGGVGYKFKNEIKSVSAGVSYYYGLVDIVRAEESSYKNASLNIFVKIPIGAGAKDTD